ncbi:hypothetical protein PHYPSEUDO_008299 [Phytophthora pseudosyringae]|uniref:Uncharacterized protein n=1 Tax=Phytophthora pseudosyringae TaxID=221518 RepID=A0A8T1VJQ6_9STRA|nr:hypothetical protein PHYPSEUDO_008299 [Phytophthora pseudosyringae]
MFWRFEDKVLVSLLVKGWFQEYTFEGMSFLAEKSSIVLGSPGIGKSTILCVLAFYLALVRKKNVLVYRSLCRKGTCLVYLGYEEASPNVVYFTVKNCSHERAVGIYRALAEKHSVWLLLDGFIFKDIPEGLETFKMLATSQHVSLSSNQATTAYVCLLSSWLQSDLFELGRSLYHFTDSDMEDRFFYSGGGVRDFVLTTAEEMKMNMSWTIFDVRNLGMYFATQGNIRAVRDRLDRLSRSFVKRKITASGESGNARIIMEEEAQFYSLCFVESWVQVIDSMYFLQALSDHFAEKLLLEFYHWALRSEVPSLAEKLYEVYLSRLASPNKLKQ